MRKLWLAGMAVGGLLLGGSVVGAVVDNHRDTAGELTDDLFEDPDDDDASADDVIDVE